MDKKGLVGFISLIAGLISYNIFYDINHFYVKKYELKSKKIKEPYHFVVISDLHDKDFGKQNDVLLKEIDRISPEAVYIAGDMITALPGRDFTNTLKFLKKLSEKYPVYYGSGNHEYRMRISTKKYGDMSLRYETELCRYGIHRIYTGCMDTNRKDVKVFGLEIDRCFYRKWKTPKMPDDYVVNRIGKVENDYFSILIAHNPEYFPEYAKCGADLVLAGHVHGGIANLPLIGGVISPKFRLFPKYDGGIFKEQNSTMLLSRGLGWHTIPVRFLNPGELVEVIVKPENS